MYRRWWYTVCAVLTEAASNPNWAKQTRGEENRKKSRAPFDPVPFTVAPCLYPTLLHNTLTWKVIICILLNSKAHGSEEHQKKKGSCYTRHLGLSTLVTSLDSEYQNDKWSFCACVGWRAQQKSDLKCTVGTCDFVLSDAHLCQAWPQSSASTWHVCHYYHI